MSLKNIAQRLFGSGQRVLSTGGRSSFTNLNSGAKYRRRWFANCVFVVDDKLLSSSSKVVSTATDKRKGAKSARLLSAADISKMATGSLPEEVKAKLDQIPDATIDSTGRFKYILIRVFVKDKDGKDIDSNSKLVVRGRSDCPYHADIFDKFQEEIAHLEGVDDDVLGGGRIERTSNKIFVFGYSQGYGKADHTLTVQVLKKKFPDHDITWSDDGY